MVKKRTSLDAILGSNKKQEAPTISNEQAKKSTPVATEPVEGKRPHVKQQALYLRHNIYKQLRLLAFEEERKMHDLCLEALNLLFANRGLPSIDELLADEE